MAQETTDAVRYYPLDVTTLAKGRVFTIEELETIMGIKRDDPRWWLKLLALRQQIEKLRAKLDLPLLTTRTHRGTLIVCDDGDASVYNRNMGRRGIRRFSRASYRNMAVDVTKLTEEQATAHGRTIMRQAMMLVALRGAQHRALPGPNGNERVTPKMVVGPVKNENGADET